jgi:hypothetical protein
MQCGRKITQLKHDHNSSAYLYKDNILQILYTCKYILLIFKVLINTPHRDKA